MTHLPKAIAKHEVRFVLGFCVMGVVAQSIILAETHVGDSSIYLIFARNLAQGQLFAFNDGEFSSGATGPLWALFLAPGFLTGTGAQLAKLVAVAMTVVAIFATYRACVALSNSPRASALATAGATWSTSLYGILLYETGLAISLIAASVIFTQRLADTSRDEPRLRDTLALTLVWAALPLTRPDCAIVVGTGVCVLLLLQLDNRGARRRILVGAAVSTLPACTYFGLSWFLTGTMSAPGHGRAFALEESAQSLAGFRYSTAGLRNLWEPVTVVLLGCTLWGQRASLSSSQRATRRWVICVVVVYLGISSVVVPASQNASRYCAPIYPLLAVSASIGLRVLLEEGLERRLAGLLPACLAVFLAIPGAKFLQRGRSLASHELNFDTVMERALAEQLNARLPHGAHVLAYEVQIRFFLRHDITVTSLDGITDTRVHPFLHSGDMRGFLNATRPGYWLVNPAIEYRPYLSSSILASAARAIDAHPHTTVQFGNIRFSNIPIALSPSPEGFAGTTRLLRIDYE